MGYKRDKLMVDNGCIVILDRLAKAAGYRCILEEAHASRSTFHGKDGKGR
jgi:hypothetical protein